MSEGHTYPCCEHCVPEANGKCWAHEVGHGCSCLKCPPAPAPARPGVRPAGEIQNTGHPGGRVTERQREILARLMFDRQAEAYGIKENAAPVWDGDPEIRAFWRAEADHVVSVLGLE